MDLKVTFFDARKNVIKMCDGGVSQLSVNIQIGLVKEKLFLDPGNLSLIGLKRLICSYIDEKFPRHEIFRLVDRLLIFRHEYASTNILQVRLLSQ